MVFRTGIYKKVLVDDEVETEPFNNEGMVSFQVDGNVDLLFF